MALPLAEDGTTQTLPVALSAPIGICSICRQEAPIIIRRRDVGEICAKCSLPFLERTLALVRAWLDEDASAGLREVTA